MALIIDDPEAEYLTHAIVTMTGEPVEQAVIAALRERLDRLDEETTLKDVLAIAQHCASLPELDPRTADEVIGYDEHGLPT